MRLTRPFFLRAALTTCATLVALAAAAFTAPLAAQTFPAAPADTLDDPVRILVSRLNLEQYKATVKGLTEFGDRRQGTERNRKAVDWIEAQLKSYGCPTARVVYTYTAPQRGGGNRGAGRGADTGAGRGRAAGAGRGNNAQGGGRYRGIRRPTGVNNDSLKQPDPAIRAVDAEPSSNGERQEVYCTKVGSVHPDEMYIVGGHMDGIGWGQAANDDGSGTALVMELARVFSNPDVKTDRTIRFALWNNEESGLNGAHAYVDQRQALQGKEDPAGSGKYPEPKWLGMIQHDMMMWDHGMPRPDGTREPGPAPGSRRERRVPGHREVGRRRAEARLVLPARERAVRDRLSGARRPAHDQHRFRSVQGHRAGDQPPRERARRADRRRLGPATGTSRPTCSRRTATRTSDSASTPRRRR